MKMDDIVHKIGNRDLLAQFNKNNIIIQYLTAHYTHED